MLFCRGNFGWKKRFILLEKDKTDDFMKYRAASFVDGKYEWINVICIHKDRICFGSVNLIEGLSFTCIGDKFQINPLMGFVCKCDKQKKKKREADMECIVVKFGDLLLLASGRVKFDSILERQGEILSWNVVIKLPVLNLKLCLSLGRIWTTMI